MNDEKILKRYAFKKSGVISSLSRLLVRYRGIDIHYIEPPTRHELRIPDNEDLKKLFNKHFSNNTALFYELVELQNSVANIENMKKTMDADTLEKYISDMQALALDEIVISDGFSFYLAPIGRHFVKNTTFNR